MGSTSSIEWTDATWPVVKGCDYASPGCSNCYAVDLIHRHAQHPNPKISLPIAGLTKVMESGRPRWTGKVYLNEPHLRDPITWAKPRMIFVPSHGDLFHEDVPDSFIDRVFAVMRIANHHTFQVLTKRAERMAEYANAPYLHQRIHEAIKGLMGYDHPKRPAFNSADWPMRNVWFGVSVEDQKRADERVPYLLQTPAAVRFLSCEPLLGPLEFSNVGKRADCVSQLGKNALDGIDWVIVGGESGKDARRCHVSWVRSIVKQCKAAGVASFTKQLGEHVIDRNDNFGGWEPHHWPDGLDSLRVEHDINGFREEYQGADCRIRLNDKKGGEPQEWPPDLRVREFPVGASSPPPRDTHPTLFG